MLRRPGRVASAGGLKAFASALLRTGSHQVDNAFETLRNWNPCKKVARQAEPRSPTWHGPIETARKQLPRAGADASMAGPQEFAALASFAGKSEVVPEGECRAR